MQLSGALLNFSMICYQKDSSQTDLKLIFIYQYRKPMVFNQNMPSLYSHSN